MNNEIMYSRYFVRKEAYGEVYREWKTGSLPPTPLSHLINLMHFSHSLHNTTITKTEVSLTDFNIMRKAKIFSYMMTELRII